VKKIVTMAAVALTAMTCSPEAKRTRDGGPGADIGNKQVTQLAHPDPHPADTTLMPGRAPAPVERFAREKQ
jgi:hypothetical protein